MRLKVDENLPVEAAEVLRQDGHDAETVTDEGLTGADDAELLARCIVEERSLLTLDLDFANTRAYPPGDYPGVVVFRLQRQDKRHTLAKCEELLRLLGTEKLSGKLWIVEEARVRIRG